MKTKLIFFSIIVILLLSIFGLGKYALSEKAEKERLIVNQNAYAIKVGSLLKTLKYKEFAWFNNQAIQTAKANGIKPQQIDHYYSLVDSFIHTDTIAIFPEINATNEVRAVKIDNKCYNVDLLLLPDTIICTVEPIYDLSLFNYFEYDRKTRVGRLIHFNWNKTYTAKCINNCNNQTIQIKENIEINK